jgi:hypothetical protein
MNVLADGLMLLAQTDIERHWSMEFFGLDQGQRFVLMIVAIGCATGIILGLAGILYSAFDGIHRRRLYADLKREMIDRGMTADEIVRIIEATPPEDATERAASAGLFSNMFGGCDAKTTD